MNLGDLIIIKQIKDSLDEDQINRVIISLQVLSEIEYKIIKPAELSNRDMEYIYND